MDKITAIIRKIFGGSSSSDSSGFTLIELLVVIAVIGILAAATLIAVDPIDRINAANDSRMQQTIGSLASASETYAVSHNGYYPTQISDLTGAGDLKNTPVVPSGYTLNPFTVAPAGCNAGTTCTSVIISGTLKSKKYSATPVWRYESSTGKSCSTTASGTC